MKENELIDALEQSKINVLMELRIGNGLYEKEYENLVRTLTICVDKWEGRNSIPKKGAFTFIELYGDMYNFSLHYADKESARIQEAAVHIKKLIQKSMKEKGEIDSAKAKVIVKLCKYIKEDGDFFKKLQNGKGMDEQQFEKIYQELNDVHNEIHTWNAMPKELVNIFIQLYELDLFVYLYKNEFKQPEEADKIYDAYERMFSLIFG